LHSVNNVAATAAFRAHFSKPDEGLALAKGLVAAGSRFACASQRPCGLPAGGKAPLKRPAIRPKPFCCQAKPVSSQAIAR
jgi:hypothetical protein